MKLFLYTATCMLLLCSCQSKFNEKNDRIAGTYKRKTDIKYKGSKRDYRLYLPQNLPKNNWPLVVVLHGAFNTDKGIEEQSGFSHLADKKSFTVAYPNGIGIFGLLQHWNAGHCCGKALKDNVDDVAYLNAVVKDLLANYPINPDRVYFVGHSNGGMMVYRYAAECTDKLAGIAVVSGAINSSNSNWCIPTPSQPVPTFIIHGTADRAIPFDGGPSPDKPDQNAFSSVKAAVDFWTKQNGTNCPVHLEVLQDWGHDWPGAYFNNTNFEVAETIWEFFESTTP